MASMLVALMGALSIVSVAADASISSIDDIPTWQQESVMSLSIENIPVKPFDVFPLTGEMGLNKSVTTRRSIHIQGHVVSATQNSYVNINDPNAVAYLCCDERNSSFITPNVMFNTLMNNKPRAILLYSMTGNACSIRGTDLPYSSIFTMASRADASDVLSATETGDGSLQAVIAGNTTSPTQDKENNQGGNNSAVAMSILYSITGLITLLFLVIIGTGAIRAHRYPERYGPRNAYGGRPRQSRARGLARAVLDTIPIVKFGQSQNSKPDPALELESAPGSRGLDATSHDPHHLSTIPEDAEAQPKAGDTSSKRASAIGADGSIVEREAETHDEEQQGCSICTEDFTVGEDVRVLPCDHKFHPQCVDPWLINVSGTCPLCRLDLSPNKDDDGSRASTEDTHYPPPLEVDGATEGESSSSAHRRRSSRATELHRLRHATAEERIEALRRYRSDAQRPGSSGATSPEPEDEGRRSARLTSRLREKFRIRTRAQPPGRPQSGPGSEPSGGAGPSSTS